MLLTIFYDGYCPLCVQEMNQLRELDRVGKLNFEDIHREGFSDRYPEVNPSYANQILQGLTCDGQMLLGLDVTARAWQLVGRKPWIQALRWPLISWVADRVYLYFARNRYAVSYWLTGKARCESCTVKSSG